MFLISSTRPHLSLEPMDSAYYSLCKREVNCFAHVQMWMMANLRHYAKTCLKALVIVIPAYPSLGMILTKVFMQIFGWHYTDRLFVTEVSCDPPSYPSNGAVIGSQGQVGAVLSFTCNHGYRREGVEKITCLPTGVWSHDVPVCQRMYCNVHIT